LKAAEKEELVLDDSAAQRSSVLIALQRVLRRGKVTSRVEVAVTQIVEQIAMELIRAGLSHCIHYAARMRAILRRQGVRLYAEFLQCIGKRKRHVDVRERVHVIPAIQQIVRAIR